MAIRENFSYTDMEEWLNAKRVTEIECLVPDLTGVARGKILPRVKFTEDRGMRIPEVVLGMTVTDLTSWLRTRIAEGPETLEHRHFSTLREIALCYVGTPPSSSALRFMPPRRERMIDVWRAVVGDDILGKDSLTEIAHRMFSEDASWMRDEFVALEARIESRMYDEALLADLPRA